MRYYLQLWENDDRIRVGPKDGYMTREEAVAVAKIWVDDALPRNTVHVLQDIGFAFLAGDGSDGFQEYKEGE